MEIVTLALRNKEDVVICTHATESIVTQPTGLIKSLNKSIKCLLWVTQKNIWIDKLCFSYSTPFAIMTEWIPLNSHDAISDTFCSSGQLFEVHFTPWNSTGRNTVVIFSYILKDYIFRQDFQSLLISLKQSLHRRFMSKVNFPKRIRKERDRTCSLKRKSSFFHLVVNSFFLANFLPIFCYQAFGVFLKHLIT